MWESERTSLLTATVPRRPSRKLSASLAGRRVCFAAAPRSSWSPPAAPASSSPHPGASRSGRRVRWGQRWYCTAQARCFSLQTARAPIRRRRRAVAFPAVWTSRSQGRPRAASCHPRGAPCLGTRRSRKGGAHPWPHLLRREPRCGTTGRAVVVWFRVTPLHSDGDKSTLLCAEERGREGGRKGGVGWGGEGRGGEGRGGEGRGGEGRGGEGRVSIMQSSSQLHVTVASYFVIHTV